MKFPTIREVAAELKEQKVYLSAEITEFDVRLQVWEDESWAVHTGDAQFDTDHRGYWGVSALSRRSNCREIARDLIAEAKDQYFSETNDPV